MEKQEANRETRELKKYKNRRHTAGPMELSVYRGNNPKVSSMSSDYAYVNSGYVGSTNSLNQTRVITIEPPTTVIREQYCVCSRWPFAQKMLVLLVGVLLGACIGLGVTMLIRRETGSFEIAGIFRHSVPD